MNTRTQSGNSWPGRPDLLLGMASLLLIVSAGCSPLSTPPPGQPAAGAAGLEADPVRLPASTTSEVPIPAGWQTHTSQQCEYAISYPADMHVTDQNPYSQTLAVDLADPQAGARNFIYVSVIPPEIQNRVQQGVYSNGEVYNYDPAEADILLNMQVGESKALRELPNGAAGFTYQRQPDTTIGGQTARTYENVQPWEFPAGIKEIRYYVSLDGCTYLVGGYMDTTGSNQPGALHEDLFHQIVATMELMP
jgi:hypothetical protein